MTEVVRKIKTTIRDVLSQEKKRVRLDSSFIEAIPC